MKAEQLRQELKHKKQWDDLQSNNQSALSELEQLQVCMTSDISTLTLISRHVLLWIHLGLWSM